VTIGAGDAGKLKDDATDVDDPFGDLAVSAIFSPSTPPGATIVLTDPATGTFTFNPPAGFSGLITFQYQVCDDGAPTPPAMCSAPATVSVNVTGPDLWFVQQGASGTGRLTDPFGTLASLPAGRGSGDRIFVFTGTYGTGLTVFTNEHLIGQGSSGAFDTVLGVTVPGNGTLDTRPTLAGTLPARPQLGGTVALGSSSVVRGLNIASAGVTGLSGGAVTGVTVREASVTSTTGRAVDLNGTGAAFSLTSVSANGAPNGIVLNGTTGSFTVTGTGTVDTGGVIQNTTGSSILATNAQNLSLTRMRISNPGNSLAFTFGIEANGLSGSSNLLSNTVIEGFNGTNGGGFRILNNSVNLGSLIITGSTFRNSTAGNAFQMETGGTSSATVSVEGGSIFTNNFGDGVQAVTTTGSTGTVNVTVKNSTFSSANTNGNGGIFFAPFGGPVTFNFDIDTNSFSDIMRPVTNLGAINVTDGDLDGGGPTVTGTIRNNTLNNIVGSRGIAVIADTFAGPFDLTIDNNNIDRLQSTSKHAINVGVRNNVTGAKVRVQNNDIGQAAALWTAGAGSAEAVLVLTQDAASANVRLNNNVIDANALLEVMRVRAIGTSTLNATVTGNDLNDTSAAHIEFAAVTASGTPTECLNISGNVLPAPGVIQLTESAGTLNVTQASSAAVATANSNANVQVTGTPAFGQPACALP